MKTGRPFIFVAHDTVVELKKKLAKSQDSAYKVRVRAMIKAHHGLSRRDIVRELSVSKASVSVWMTRYNKGGTDLLVSNRGGRPEGNPKWDADIFKELAKEIDKGGYWSIPCMQEWLRKNHKKDIPEQTVWYRMDKLNYSYKSARPHPVQGNRERQEAFKKGGLPHSWSR